jgi:DNA-binding CsgD family transcriptional regulator
MLMTLPKIDADINELLPQIHDTVQNQGLWPEVLSRFSDIIGARGCIISEIEGIGEATSIVTPYVCARYDVAQIQKYLKSYIQYEMLDQARYELLSKDSDGIDLIDQATLFGDKIEEFKARPNVQRMHSIGVRERAGGLLDKDNKRRARFSIHFGEESAGLTDEVRALMRSVLPHIAKAIDNGRSTRHLNSLNQKMLAAMDRLRMGVCILDRFGQVEIANTEFKRQVEAYPTYTINGDQRLQIHDTADHSHLVSMLSDIQNNGKNGARPRKAALIIGPKSSNVEIALPGALCVEVTPLHRLDELGSKAFDGAIIFSLDTDQPIPPDLELMKIRYGLTKTEATVLELVAGGLSNAEIAARRGRSLDTINTQIKKLIFKTSAANRTNLVRLMASFSSDYLLPVPGEVKETRKTK